MSYLAFTPRVVPDTTGLVANLVDFITQLSGTETGSISVGFPSIETFAEIKTVNNSKRFGNIFSEQERARLNKFNHEIYAAYIIRQAQFKNVVWDLFLQQAITFQSEQIVLQMGDTLSRKFTDLPWWFALVLYSQACLTARIERQREESNNTEIKLAQKPIWGKARHPKPDLSSEKKNLAQPDAGDEQLRAFAHCVLDQVTSFLRDKGPETTPADLIVMHHICLAWLAKTRGLQQRLVDLQRKPGARQKSEELLIQNMTTQIAKLQEAYTPLLIGSPLTYLSTSFEPGNSRQSLEHVVRKEQAYGLQRWMAREWVKPCSTNAIALQHISALFMDVCRWAAQDSTDEYLAYQWRVFLLYCYEQFAVEHNFAKETIFRNLPSSCIDVADAFFLLDGAFNEASQDLHPNGTKELFLNEYRWYQDQDAGVSLTRVLWEALKGDWNIQGPVR